MYNLRDVLRGAISLYFRVVAINVVIGVLISLIFGYSLDGALEVLGNLSIIEAAIFFIVGGLKNVFHSPSASTLRNFLKLGGGNWTIEELRNAEKKGVVYIITAFALMAGTILFALLR